MDERERQTPGPVERWEASEEALEASHRHGMTRLEAVAPDIMRVRFTPLGGFAPTRAWDVVEALPPARARLIEGDGTIGLAAEALSVVLDVATGATGFHRSDGTRFAEDLGPPGWREMTPEETALEHMPEAELPPGVARTALFLDKRMAPDEGYFGFGQRTGRLDRRHRRLTHWTIDRSSPGHCRGNDNMYQAHPVFMAVRPGLAWGLYLHSTWYSTFDVGAEREGVLTLFTLGGELDYYLFAGPTPAAVIEQLTRLTGRPALPPLWALGFHQSRWSYGSDAEVRAIAAGFRSRDIPLDVIHIDIDYMDDFRVFTWDNDRFPNPAATIAALHEQDVRVVPIVDPGVKRELEAGYSVADEGVAGDHFVKRLDGNLFSGWVWPGESLFPDFCRTDTRYWWGDQHASLVAVGADGIWCDMNEPSIVDRPFGTHSVRDQPIPLSARHGDMKEALQAETHNLYGLLMARATAEGLERLRPGRRPWVLTRSGYVGVQRWAASWMGDNHAWWEHLEMSLPQLASMGLSGSPHVGVDIGGFYHNCFPELFARWIELGTFYPFMRDHAHRRCRPQEPWAFGPEVEVIARRAIELRYRLLPYLYTLAHRAHRSGEPLLRPLLYDFPDATDLHTIEDQVMVGPQLMIAPVCQPGVRRRLVELPPGTWYRLRSGARIGAGPAPLIMEAPLGAMPILVRGGSVLTLGNVRQSTAASLTELTLEVFPDPSASGGWTLIEDAGEGFDYRQGGLAETRFEVTVREGVTTVTIGARGGDYHPHPRSLVVRVHLAEPPVAVWHDGRATNGWRWDDAGQAVELAWPDDGAAHRLELR